MNLTNKYGLSPVILHACNYASDSYDKAGDVSVSTLLDSQRVTELKRQHWHELEEDVTDQMARLFGTALHHVMEQGALRAGYICEERIVVDFEGTKLSMKADFISPEGILSDIKTGTVYVWKMGGKESYRQQLNIYRWGYEQVGYKVTSLENILFLKDWTETGLETKESYPVSPIISLPVDIMFNIDVENLLRQRISAWRLARAGKLPECTSDERWQRETKYAVKKKGNKMAAKGGVFDIEEEAIAFADTLDYPTEIEYRPGRNLRCDRNSCLVAQWCSQWARIQEESL